MAALLLTAAGVSYAVYHSSGPYVRIGLKSYPSLESALFSIPEWTSAVIDVKGEVRIVRSLYLTRRNITLQGDATLTNSEGFCNTNLIDVAPDATLTIGRGVIIQGRGEVLTLNSLGHVILDGGAISGVRQDNTWPVLHNFDPAVFEMKSGTISAGPMACWAIISTGSFTMSGGEIVGNTTDGQIFLNRGGTAHFTGGIISAPECANYGASFINDYQGGISTNTGTAIYAQYERVN